jgi:hypothetical protein
MRTYQIKVRKNGVTNTYHGSYQHSVDAVFAAYASLGVSHGAGCAISVFCIP